MAKVAVDFQHTPEQSVLWGDPHILADDIKNNGWFRVLSHNVNGLSSSNYDVDLKQFVSTMKKKTVALFGIQETNQNFERKAMRDGIFSHVRSNNLHC